MFEQKDVKTIGKTANQAENGSEKPKFVWKQLPVADLIRYLDEIRSVLPATDLKDLNLEEEMLLQYHALRELQNDVLSDSQIALNQRAQVANSVAAALAKLADLQINLWSSERFKQIENLLIRSLSRLPEATATEFLEEYRRVLEQRAQ